MQATATDIDRQKAHQDRAAEEMGRARNKADRQRALNFALSELRECVPLAIVKEVDGSRRFTFTCGLPGCEEWATSVSSAGPDRMVCGCSKHSV